MVVEKEKTWDEALDYCWNVGSYLIEINSHNERDFLRDTLLSNYNGVKFWIGATLFKTCEEGFRYRRTGRVVSNYWAQEQPEIGTDKYCVSMSLSNGDFGLYNEYCCLKSYFVCEYKLSAFGL